jgi:hypothetical protein
MTFKQMVIGNVNEWRRRKKLPPAGHESPGEFQRNFNSLGEKLTSNAH